MEELQWPGQEGILAKPIRIEDSNIEIVRAFDGRDLTTGLADWDGTVSKEREGWQTYMVTCYATAIVSAGVSMTAEEAMDWACEDIENTTGMSTYRQMERLRNKIINLGGHAKEAMDYKNTYKCGLDKMLTQVYQRLESGELCVDDLIVKRAKVFFQKLSDSYELYLASGSDDDAIRRSVSLLGFRNIFRDNILGAGKGGDFTVDAKEAVVNRLVYEHGVGQGQMLAVGDGPHELAWVYHAGLENGISRNVCVGVLSRESTLYQTKGYFTLAKKREKLIRAGAHIIVPDFNCWNKLIMIIGSYCDGQIIHGV